MNLPATNLKSAEQLALSALAQGGRVANLLAPGGAVGAAVGDILSAAGDVVKLVNTVDTTLASFTSSLNDPIKNLFSKVQPYAGTFITSPTVAQLTRIDFSQLLSSTTNAISNIASGQLSALAGRTGISINTDADLSTAMGTLFTQTTDNLKAAFSVNLSDITSIIPTSVTSTLSQIVSIPPLTEVPDINQLSSFVSQVSKSFPNISGIEGVAASIWSNGLGNAVDTTGNSIPGIPSNIDRGVLSDITGSISNITGTTLPSTTDYAFQQNKFNLTTALSVDNGLSGSLSTLLSSGNGTDETTQVIKNRLDSVAQRGDASMLGTMFTSLGQNDIPDATSHITTLLQNVAPVDYMNTTTPPTIVASGIPITTTVTPQKSTDILNSVNTLCELGGTTINNICTQNTGNNITFGGQSLLNAPLMKSMNRGILSSLTDPTVVNMAHMF